MHAGTCFGIIICFFFPPQHCKHIKLLKITEIRTRSVRHCFCCCWGCWGMCLEVGLMCVTKNVSGPARLSGAYLWEQRDWGGHCGIDGRRRMTLWHQGDRIRGKKQRARRRWRWSGERGSPSCQLWGAAGRLSGSPAWPPGCLVTTARPWNAPAHNGLPGLRGHSDLITTLKS